MAHTSSVVADGTTSTPKRQFRMRDAFTLAFIFISPIVALYSVFGLIIQAAGPAGFWVFPIGLALQLLIAVSLGILVSRWPFQGGSYQWARRLVGENYGWATGWFYIWTIVIVFASGGYAVATYLPPVLGIRDFTLTEHILVAVLVLAGVTALNLLGPTVLKILSRLSLAAEVLGSVGIATVLLIWHRQQDFSVLFTTAGVSHDNYFLGGFLLAVGFVGFGFAGFETVCSMAEEIDQPERNLPKAIAGALIAIGVVVMYSALALYLATPDFGAIISGALVDPAAGTIQAALGDGVARVFFILVIIGFVASMMMAQTSISRVMWSFARDGVFPASSYLTKLSGKNRTPNRAIVVVGVLAVVVTLLAFSERVYATLISSATTSFFITMGLVVVALLVRIVGRKWRRGPFWLGWASVPVVVGASCWIIFEITNIVWPRSAPGQPWFVTWAVLIGVLAIGALGFIVWVPIRGRVRTAEALLEATPDDAPTSRPAAAS